MVMLSAGMIVTIFFCVLLVVRGVSADKQVDSRQVAGDTDRKAASQQENVRQMEDLAVANPLLSSTSSFADPSSPLPASGTVARLIQSARSHWAIGSNPPHAGDDLAPGAS